MVASPLMRIIPNYHYNRAISMEVVALFTQIHLSTRIKIIEVIIL